jgi:hypothetical protein
MPADLLPTRMAARLAARLAVLMRIRNRTDLGVSRPVAARHAGAPARMAAKPKLSVDKYSKLALDEPPLRNRTVDLLLTMGNCQVFTVRLCRSGMAAARCYVPARALLCLPKPG